MGYCDNEHRRCIFVGKIDFLSLYCSSEDLTKSGRLLGPFWNSEASLGLGRVVEGVFVHFDNAIRLSALTKDGASSV
jgi:hypothetical protein